MPKRILSGNVVRVSDKTVSVVVWSKRRHHLYNKQIKVRTKYLVHNPDNTQFEKDQEIRIIECRPMSARKRFCVLKEVGSGN